VIADEFWSMGKAAGSSGRLSDVRGFTGGMYGPDLHAKRIDALAAATLGVMAGASARVGDQACDQTG
jgi:hypothetical protein